MKQRKYILLTKEDVAIRITAESAIEALVEYAHFISLWHISKNLCAKTLRILCIEEAVAFLNAHIIDEVDSVKAVYANYDTVYEENNNDR